MTAGSFDSISFARFIEEVLIQVIPIESLSLGFYKVHSANINTPFYPRLPRNSE